jgi:hypothetical protein
MNEQPTKDVQDKAICSGRIESSNGRGGVVSNLNSNEVVSGSPVLKSFTKEQLLGRAQEFLHLQIGDVRMMERADQRGYHEIAGILMFYVEHLWEQS